MPQQQQTHQLGHTWQAEDYANHSQQSAYAAKQYHQLVSQQAGVIEARFDRLEQEIRLLREENRQIKSVANEPRNQAIIWGAGSAIVAGLVVSLIFAPSNSPRHIEQSSGVTFQFGGQ